MTELFFRAAVRLYPARIRLRFGAEMLLYMRAGYDRRTGLRGRLAYWRAFAADLGRALWATWTDQTPRSTELPMFSLTRDLLRSTRDLLRNPGFAVPTILTLAIGIGSSAAVFALLNGIVLAPLPYSEPERLVRIFEQNSPTNRFNISAVDYLAIEERQRAFESVAAYTAGNAVLDGGARPVQVRNGLVTAGFFATLGVHPAEGRGFIAGEDRVGAAAVVVLSAALRDQHFGVGVDAVGDTIVLEGTAHTVVGVMSPGFQGIIAPAADLWRPVQLGEPSRRGPFFLSGLARLGADQSEELASADLADISKRIYPIWADSFRDETVILTLLPLHEAMVGRVSGSLVIVFAAVALVLAVAVANVVNLVLARAIARCGEFAVRAAIGASRLRIACLLLTDGLVIATVGAGFGLAVAWVSLAGFRAADAGLPRMAQVGIDGPTLLFTLVVTALAALAFGFAPMALTADRSLARGLKSGARGAIGSRATQRFRTALVVVEFALVLPLLVAGTLLAVSLLNLNRVDPGFDPTNVLVVPIGLPSAGYSETDTVATFWREAKAAIADIPGVESVGVAIGLPPNAPLWHNNFDLVDRPVEAGTTEPVSPWSAVDDGVLEALGLRLTAGRWFDETLDGDTDGLSLVVTESWASHFYPGESPIGKQLYEGGDRANPASIIGVIGDIKYDGLAAGGEAVYFPAYQFWRRAMSLVVRVQSTTPAVSTAIRQGVMALDASLPAPDITTMEERLSDSIARQRLWTSLLVFFGAGAILLTAVGLFGVLVHAVRQQTREIGVRMALGADRRAIVRMVLVRGLSIAGVGMAVGLALSVVATRTLESLLFGVGRNDPLALGAACVGLLAVAGTAAYLPARRASRTDPVEAINAS
jgi:putative ABC transport system permease protein